MRMLYKVPSSQDLGWWKHLWGRNTWCWVPVGGWAEVFSNPGLFSPQAKLKHKLTTMYSQINGASRALEDVRARQQDVQVSDRLSTTSPGPGAFLGLQAGQARL